MKRLSLSFCVLLAAASAFPLACSDDEPDRGGEGGNVGGCGDGPACPEGTVCSPDGVCVACASDGDCGRAQRCDAGSFECVFRPGWGDECAVHEDCSFAMACAQGLCRPSEEVTWCGSLGQCGEEGLICNRELGVCEEDIGCFDDEDCLEEQICNVGKNACEPRCTPETELEICNTRETCVDGRCVECREDADCRPGLVCDVDAGECRSENTCFTTRDCPAGLVCNRATSTCTEEPPPCTSDGDCLSDERCELRTGRCVLKSCQPDLDEPNDDRDAAVAIAAGHRTGLTLCPATDGKPDVDWYKLALRRGDRVNVNMEADILAANGLDVQLQDADGRELGKDPFLVDAVATRDGEHFVRISTFDAQARYGFNVLVVRGVPCDEDGFEENDEVGDAKAVPYGTTRNLQACPADPDWYVVDVGAGETVEVSISHDPLQGDLDLVVFDSDGQTQLGASRTTSGVETVTVKNVSAGKAYVLVVPGDARTRNAYDLAVAAK